MTALRIACAFAAPLVLLLSAACGSDSNLVQPFGVTVVPIADGTPAMTSARIAPVGGKPAAPASAPRATATPAADVAAASVAAPEEDPPPSQPDPAQPGTTDATATEIPAPQPTPTVAPLASDGSVAPTTGRWIDVNVTTFEVRLMDGAAVAREIQPVAVGSEVDTGEYASTQTGLFRVYNKIEELAYDPPYDTYISHWVGFDPDKANGFHSFLKDEQGNVVDPATGRISNGCIRTEAAAAIFAYAELDMPVWVHH